MSWDECNSEPCIKSHSGVRNISHFYTKYYKILHDNLRNLVKLRSLNILYPIQPTYNQLFALKVKICSCSKLIKCFNAEFYEEALWWCSIDKYSVSRQFPEPVLEPCRHVERNEARNGRDHGFMTIITSSLAVINFTVVQIMQAESKRMISISPICTLDI